jgi:Predicted integral membrane protein (DUF2269)
MDYYLLLRLGHIAGFILLGGGLLAVFVSELRAHTTDEVHVFTEAAWYTAIFYDALVLPGALLVGLSGLLLILSSASGFSKSPGSSVCGACSCSSSWRGTLSRASNIAERSGNHVRRWLRGT